MEKTDIAMLTEAEARSVDNSFFKQNSLPSRFGIIMLGAFLATATVLILLAYQVSIGSMAAAAVLFIAIASLEKVTYLREQMNTRGAIRKLVHRIEHLEGVPLTPDDAKPSKLAADTHPKAKSSGEAA